MDCSPPGSSVHGILQARILGWVAMPSSRGSSWPRDQTCRSCLGRRGFTTAVLTVKPLSLGASSQQERMRKSPRKPNHVLDAEKGTGISFWGWMLPRVVLGSSPSLANHKSEGRPRMERGWVYYVPEAKWMLWMKSALSQPRQSAAKWGDPGFERLGMLRWVTECCRQAWTRSVSGEREGGRN